MRIQETKTMRMQIHNTDYKKIVTFFLKKLLRYFSKLQKIMLCNMSFVYFSRNCYNISTHI
jgi:hypothetical protein